MDLIDESTFDIEEYKFYEDYQDYDTSQPYSFAFSQFLSSENTAILVLLIAILCRLAHFVCDISMTTRPTGWTCKNLISIACGCTQLYVWFQSYRYSKPDVSHIGFLIMLTIISYATAISLSVKVRGTGRRPDGPDYQRNIDIIDLLFMMLPILCNEFMIILLGRREYCKNRGLLMILAMKFLTGWSRISSNLLDNLAYFLHPSSSIYGPWHDMPQCTTSKDDGPRSITRSELAMNLLKQIFASLLSLLIAIIIMEFENYIFFQQEKLPAFCQIYLSGLGFRLGHYWVSYFSMAAHKLWDNSNSTRFCDIIGSEMPRSLSSLATSWNIPVHYWLKLYVFKPINSKSNNYIPVTILITYFISSMLHGLKSPIWIALLSVGVLSFVENMIRNSLAYNLNACILSRPCKVDRDGHCTRGHQRKAHHKVVIAINMIFSILALSHLTQVSYILNGDSDETSLGDVALMGSELGFLPMWICIFYLTGFVITI